MSVVECECNWACVTQPNKMSGKYQIDLINLTKAQVKQFEEAGVPVKDDKEDQGNYVTAKSQRPVKVYKRDRTPWPEDELIGNGSVVRVSWSPYDWTHKAKKGISAGIQAVVVMEHVPFISQDEELFEGLEDEAADDDAPFELDDDDDDLDDDDD